MTHRTPEKKTGILAPVPFNQVRFADEFWAPRLRTLRETTIPHALRQCESTGRIRNFDRAAGALAGEFEGWCYNDSDVYKVIEGVAHSLATQPDPRLEANVETIIGKIAAAQDASGYLNTYYTVAKPAERFTDFKDGHELYCAGHLFEAGVAWWQATGKRSLLDVARRFADFIVREVGPAPGQKRVVCGHEEIELALVKLARATGDTRYLKMAAWFVDERGVERPGRALWGEYYQDHKPVRELDSVCGHAVRAMYLLTAMTDLAAITGDAALVSAIERTWTNVISRNLYVTGGVGSTIANEGFTADYDLPNDTAYCETCAAMGLVMWNHRLNLLQGDARYMDFAETALYNNIPASLSLDGTGFFYANPLASKGHHHRQEWFDTACCPSSVVRFLASVAGYFYAQSDEAACVNLYAAGMASLSVGGTPVTLTQETLYPWDGRVRIRVDAASVKSFALLLRIPGWCRGATVSINGAPPAAASVGMGYARIEREWKPGDFVDLVLPLEIRRVECHPAAPANRGRVALMRGPVVYCAEVADHPDRPVSSLSLPRDSQLTAVHRPEILGGVTTIEGPALANSPARWNGALYRDAAPGEPARLTAIPYCVWDNRTPGEMTVWLPESVGLAEPLHPDEPARQTCPGDDQGIL